MNRIILNLLIAVYFWFISPIFGHNISDIMNGIQVSRFESINIYFGIALITIQVLETYAFFKKMKYVRRSILERKPKLSLENIEDLEASAMVLCFFHMVVSMVMLFAAAALMGANMDVIFDENLWFIALSFFIVIKEIILLMSLIGLQENDENLEEYKRPNSREWKIDLILFFYSCLAYTATWGSISVNTPMNKENPPMYALNLFVAATLFLMFYMPIRIPYFIEGLSRKDDEKDLFKFLAPLGLVVLSVIFSL